MSLGNDHAIWQQVGNTSSGFSWQYFNDHGPDSKDYDGKDRDRYKKWFNDHIMLFESYHIIQYWIHDNPAEYKKFLNEFISSYNTLASRMMMPKIETVDPSLQGIVNCVFLHGTRENRVKIHVSGQESCKFTRQPEGIV